MSIQNSDIKVVVLDNTGALVPNANVEIIVSNQSTTIATNNLGVVIYTLALSNITLATVTITCDGFITVSNSFLIGIGQNEYDVVIYPGPSLVYRNLTIVDSSGSPIQLASVSINGVYIGLTDNSGNIVIKINDNNLTIKVSKSGYTDYQITDTLSQSSFPARIILAASSNIPQNVNITTVSNALVKINNGSIFTAVVADTFGTARLPTLLVPGNYVMTISATGFITKTSNLIVLAGVNNYTSGILETDYGN